MQKKKKKKVKSRTTWIVLQALLKQRCTLVGEINKVYTVKQVKQLKKKAKLMLQNNDPQIVQK